MRSRASFAFTLIELLVVIGILGILAILVMPLISQLRQRAQGVQCMANLKTLYVATSLYLQQNEQWPQIEMGDDEDDSSPMDFGNGWITALKPFGVSEKNWICPTMQESLHNPDYTKPANTRVDYVATPFDDKPTTPHEWPTQPWFIEVGDVHGHGNLIVFTDGSAADLKTVLGNR